MGAGFSLTPLTEKGTKEDRIFMKIKLHGDIKDSLFEWERNQSTKCLKRRP